MNTNTKTRAYKSLELLFKTRDITNQVQVKIWDLGHPNELANWIMDRSGFEFIYRISDLNKNILVPNTTFDMITSFEVFEHLYNPFPAIQALSKIKVPLVASVPLRFPLSKMYWTDDYYDRHFNEFEPRQFRWLLNEAGYEIYHEEFWKWDPNLAGVRPFLRSFMLPSWMAVICLPKGMDHEKN